MRIVAAFLLSVLFAGAISSGAAAQSSRGWRPTNAVPPSPRGSRPVARVRPAPKAASVRPVSYEVVSSEAAAEPKPADVSALTLADLQNLAAGQNPTLAQARSGTWRAWGQYVQAGLYPNPQVAYTAQEIGEEGNAGNQGVQVSQQFVRGGKLGLSQNVAAEDRQLAEDRLAAQQLRVANAVRREFYSVLAAAVRKSLAEELVRVARKIKLHIDKRIADGRGIELEEVQAKLELQRSLLILEQAERQEKAAWRQLEAIVGMRLSDRVVAGSLEDELPALKWDQLLAGVESSNPLIEQARTRARRAHAALRRAEVQPTPDLFVTLGTAYQTSADTQVANLQIGMPLPVFNRNEGNITSAEAQTIAATREVERLSLKMQHRLAGVFREYEQSRAQVVQFQQHVLPLTQKTLELSEKGFRDGRLPFLQWLTAQRNFTQTRQQYAEALASLWQSVVSLEGQLLDDGLAHPEDGL
jgi:cobalt-zinc-cadmium efflux system outer membrane protein